MAVAEDPACGAGFNVLSVCDLELCVKIVEEHRLEHTLLELGI